LATEGGRQKLFDGKRPACQARLMGAAIAPINARIGGMRKPNLRVQTL
jgi:hypothetical protein